MVPKDLQRPVRSVGGAEGFAETRWSGGAAESGMAVVHEDGAPQIESEGCTPPYLHIWDDT